MPSVDPSRVTCFDSPAGAPSAESCDLALTRVPITVGRRRFGPAGRLDVDLGVPVGWSYRNAGQDCSIVLNTKNRAVVTTSWQTIWVAASSIAGICVRRGQSGVYKEYGKKFLLAFWGGLY